MVTTYYNGTELTTTCFREKGELWEAHHVGNKLTCKRRVVEKRDDAYLRSHGYPNIDDNVWPKPNTWRLVRI